MQILVACEESQAVTIELRKRGHEAYSCDIIECSGGHPEWHIRGDALKLINGAKDYGGWSNCFVTQDGKTHFIPERWDMIIAFPPCTHLACSGAKHFSQKRADGRQRQSIEFFMRFIQADCDKIAVENPRNILLAKYVNEHFPDLAEKYGFPLKSTQIIQPYEHGHEARKQTHLWLKNLPLLQPTNIVEPKLKVYEKNGRRYTFSADYGSGDKNAGARRSKTYPGIARAMAEQWTPDLFKE